MTTPSSGQIAASDVNNEVGWGTTASLGMDWVTSVGKTAVQGPTNQYTDYNNMHNKAYYQDTTRGNCNNADVSACNCNCGNVNCSNCVNCTAINCTNCDARAYLQPACNCACTYNCTTSATSYNCNCDCSIFCPCW